MTDKEKSLQKVIDEKVDNRKVFGTSFSIKKDDFVWHGNSGNFSANQSYFIASTTKLFTTATILKLKADGNLNLDDKVSNYIDDSILAGLHIFKGKEYSARITIKHLLAHTSGLSDYFQGKGANGKSLEDELVIGNDQSWTFEQAIDRAKKIPSPFAPGTKNKALYSDTNFQLLGRIIEVITGKSYSENCNDLIINPLELTKTYLYQDPALFSSSHD